METFGERMKRMRLDAHMSVVELAGTIGVTPDAVQKIESGKRGRTFVRLPKIAKALDCRIDDLFPEMDEVKTVSANGFEDDSLDNFEM